MRDIPFHEIDPVFTYGELKIYLLTDEAGDPEFNQSIVFEIGVGTWSKD